MKPDVTWYEVLGLLPGAEPRKIRREYEARCGRLSPELISGAPSNVLTAVTRARGLLDGAWQVLGDPANRVRYDEEAGFRDSGGGLNERTSRPWEPAVNADDLGLVAETMGGDILGGLLEWLGPARRRRRRGAAPVPDVRGLFSDACRDVAHRHGLEITSVRLTKRPMPVEGLVVSQDPAPGTVRRGGQLTVQVWHPPAR